METMRSYVVSCLSKNWDSAYVKMEGKKQENKHTGQVWSWGSTHLGELSPTLQPTFFYKYACFTTQPLYQRTDNTRKEDL